MFQRFGSRRVFIALAVTAVVAGSVVAFARASAPEVTFGITLYPAPVVTAGQQTLAIVKFANVGGNSLNHVTVTVPLPAGSAFLSSLSSGGCTSSGGTVTCLVGRVAAGGSATRFIVFTAPAAGSLTLTSTVTWDESLNNSVHQDTTTASATANVVSGTDANALGTCSSSNADLATAAATSGAGNQVNTVVKFSTNSQGLPCTPISVQDDVSSTITTCTAKPCVGSSATLPQLASPAIVTITFDGSLFPPPGGGPNPNSFVVYEVAGNPSGDPVPKCSTGTTTPYGTCEVGASKYGSRGIQVTLKVPGRAIDPQWFG